MDERRRKSKGFIGVKLVIGDDRTLFNRLEQEAKNTTMSRSLIIRLALKEYFEKIDTK